MLEEQQYCDWCYGPIDDLGRRRSREIGIGSEQSWACTNCLEAGFAAQPPQGWLGDPETWPPKLRPNDR
jgi:hypothetical protein